MDSECNSVHDFKVFCSTWLLYIIIIWLQSLCIAISKSEKKTDSNKNMLVKYSYINVLNINCYLLTRLISKNKFYFTNFSLSTKLYRYPLFAILLQGSTPCKWCPRPGVTPMSFYCIEYNKLYCCILYSNNYTAINAT